MNNMFNENDGIFDIISEYEILLGTCKYVHGVHMLNVPEAYDFNEINIPINSQSLEFIIVAQDADLCNCGIVITPELKIYFKVSFSRTKKMIVEVRSSGSILKCVNNLKFNGVI